MENGQRANQTTKPTQGEQSGIMSRPIKNPGTLQDGRLVLWRAIKRAERRMERAEREDDANMTLRCFHALSQGLGQYARLWELTEMDERLTALEHAQGVRRVA